MSGSGLQWDTLVSDGCLLHLITTGPVHSRSRPTLALLRGSQLFNSPPPYTRGLLVGSHYKSLNSLCAYMTVLHNPCFCENASRQIFEAGKESARDYMNIYIMQNIVEWYIENKPKMDKSVMQIYKGHTQLLHDQ